MAQGLRLAEFLAALSLVTDLGMGQPLEQALRTCLIALALGERLGLGSDDLADVYYVALLRFQGCTADAHDFAETVGGDDIAVRAAIAPVLGGSAGEFASAVMPHIGTGHNPLARAGLVLGVMRGGKEVGREGIRAHCELSQHLAVRLGLSAAVRSGLQRRSSSGTGRGCATAGPASRSRCQHGSFLWRAMWKSSTGWAAISWTSRSAPDGTNLARQFPCATSFWRHSAMLSAMN